MSQRPNNFPMSVRCRVSIATYEKLLDAADMAGMSIGRYARYRLEGSHVPDKSKLRLMNELRRQGGLMKLLAKEGQPTGPLIDEIRKTLNTIQQEGK